MAKNKKPVKNAIESAQKGDAVALRKHIKEALHQKIKAALARKEKEIAKSFLDGQGNN